MKSFFVLALLITSLGLAGCTLMTTKSTQSIPKVSIAPINNKLDLSNKGLTQISQDVFNNTSLVELNVSHNSLSGALPSQIRNLKNLEVLDASNNQMTGVPAEIGQLQYL